MYHTESRILTEEELSKPQPKPEVEPMDRTDLEVLTSLDRLKDLYEGFLHHARRMAEHQDDPGFQQQRRDGTLMVVSKFATTDPHYTVTFRWVPTFDENGRLNNVPVG